MDCSPPGSSVHGTLQARVLEWGAIAFFGSVALLLLLLLSRLSRVRLCATPETAAHQAPPSLVLPNGTGYVTDLGMTGPKHSVLGIRPDLSIAKFRGDLTDRYRWADGDTKLEAVLFTIDSKTGLCLQVERVDLND